MGTSKIKQILDDPKQFDFLLKLLIQAGAKFGDMVIDGKKLSDDQVRGIVTLDALIKINGKKLVANTDNDLDDAAVEELLKLTKDTIEDERGLALAAVPDYYQTGHPLPPVPDN